MDALEDFEVALQVRRNNGNRDCHTTMNMHKVTPQIRRMIAKPIFKQEPIYDFLHNTGSKAIIEEVSFLQT